MIIGDLVNHGYTVETDTEYSLVLSRKLNSSEEMLAALFVGNSYSSNSRIASYTFVRDGGNVRVLCAAQVRAQMPGGQLKTMPLDDNGHVFNNFYQQLADIKKKVETPLETKRTEAAPPPIAATPPALP